MEVPVKAARPGFRFTLVLAFAIFGLTTLVLWMPWVEDGHRRVGFPMAFCVQQTPDVQCPPHAPGVALTTIGPAALVIDFAMALAAAVLVSVVLRRGKDRGRRFVSILLVSFALFGMVTLSSYFLLSDGLGLPGVSDGNRFVGFPTLICREGGQANVVCDERGRAIYTRVEPLALLVDFGTALLAAFLVPVLVSRLKR
jgi:hypothetical protein